MEKEKKEKGVVKYFYVITELVEKFGFTTNAVLVDYLLVPDEKVVAKLLFYLYKKGYNHWNLPKVRKVVIEVKDSKQRKRLNAILHYYGLTGYVRRDILVSDEPIAILRAVENKIYEMNSF